MKLTIQRGEIIKTLEITEDELSGIRYKLGGEHREAVEKFILEFLLPTQDRSIKLKRKGSI